MNDDTARDWTGPITPQPGLPLRVAAYSRIAEAIRRGALPGGSLLPTETELGTLLKVSRTVIREALMLLEEDGLVRTRRGVGRFVAESLPRLGIERIQPFEEVFAAPGAQLALERVQTVLQPASEFVAPGVGIAPDAECLLWETVVSRDGEAIAHLQEHVGAEPGSPGGHPDVLAALDAAGPASTMLAALAGVPGGALGPGTCEISLSTVGPSRAKLLDLRASDPVLVLTQHVRRQGRPLYLAKCLVAARAGHLSLRQS
ncbi:GntR family transcriptional regulator [Sinomonas halotolerans]|uniref:GntR family transcriptional regulator n=1 Tax=Sinomonas halotolerans TaxID=1644133 RepID=A0ABU9WY03_9MICC